MTTDAKPSQQNLPGAYTDGAKEEGQESRKEYPNGIRQRLRRESHRRRSKKPWQVGTSRWSGELCKINRRSPSHLNEMC